MEPSSVLLNILRWEHAPLESRTKCPTLHYVKYCCELVFKPLSNEGTLNAAAKSFVVYSSVYFIEVRENDYS